MTFLEKGLREGAVENSLARNKSVQTVLDFGIEEGYYQDIIQVWYDQSSLGPENCHDHSDHLLEDIQNNLQFKGKLKGSTNCLY